jgi:hypothetical protein
MLALFLIICAIPISVVTSTSWKPRWQTVYMKDFVNSRNLPVVSPPSGASGFTSRKQEAEIIIPDDLTRGGHTLVKTIVGRSDSNDTTAISNDISTENLEDFRQDMTTSQPSVLKGSSKQMQSLDINVTHIGEEKQKKLWSSAARIAKKLKVRICHRIYEMEFAKRFHPFSFFYSSV